MSKTIEHDGLQESLQYRDDNSGCYEQGLARQGKSVASRLRDKRNTIQIEGNTTPRSLAFPEASAATLTVTPLYRRSSAAKSIITTQHRRDTIQQYLVAKEKQKSLTILDRINQYKEQIVLAQRSTGNE